MKAILPALPFHHCQRGGANVVAIKVTDDELRLAYSFGASVVINAAEFAAIIEITGGGAHTFPNFSRPADRLFQLRHQLKQGRLVRADWLAFAELVKMDSPVAAVAKLRHCSPTPLGFAPIDYPSSRAQ